MATRIAATPYATQGHDATRRTFETRFFRRQLPGLLAAAPGRRVLDLGCGSGMAALLEDAPVSDYCGVDLRAAAGGCGGRLVVHDLREGLGPVGPEPFDLYLGAFGIASHLTPCQLRALLAGIADHAGPGAIVALEALGLYSLEWPRLWSRAPGAQRTLAYRLGADVAVHPWAPAELRELFTEAGIRPLRALDRTVQAGPKAPRLRAAVNSLLDGGDAVSARADLGRPLGALPAGAAAQAHHELAGERRRLVSSFTGSPKELAEEIWSLDPDSGRGLGHGLLLVGRVA